MLFSIESIWASISEGVCKASILIQLSGDVAELRNHTRNKNRITSVVQDKSFHSGLRIAVEEERQQQRAVCHRYRFN